jgi:hypothetical protein
VAVKLEVELLFTGGNPGVADEHTSMYFDPQKLSVYYGN